MEALHRMGCRTRGTRNNELNETLQPIKNTGMWIARIWFFKEKIKEQRKFMETACNKWVEDKAKLNVQNDTSNPEKPLNVVTKSIGFLKV